MFGVFSWIRNGVRQAVLAGLADAVGDVTGSRVEDGDARLSRLLAPSAPVDVTPPAGTTSEGDPTRPVLGNGKSGRKAKAPR